jgi:hypothetical protein
MPLENDVLEGGKYPLTINDDCSPDVLFKLLLYVQDISLCSFWFRPWDYGLDPRENLVLYIRRSPPLKEKCCLNYIHNMYLIYTNQNTQVKQRI